MGPDSNAAPAPPNERTDHGARITTGLLLFGLGGLVWAVLWWLGGTVTAALGQPLPAAVTATAAWLPLAGGILAFAVTLAVLWSTASTRDHYSHFAVAVATSGAAAQTVALHSYPVAVVIALIALAVGAVVTSITLQTKPTRRRSFVTNPAELRPMVLMPLVVLTVAIAAGGLLGSAVFQFLPYFDYASDPQAWQQWATEQYRPSEFGVPSASDDVASVALLPFIASIALGLVGLCATPVALVLAVPLRVARAARRGLAATEERPAASGIRFTTWLLVVSTVLAIAHVIGVIIAIVAGAAAHAGPLPLELRLPFALQAGCFFAIAATVLLTRFAANRGGTRWWWFALLWAGAPIVLLLAFSGA